MSEISRSSLETPAKKEKDEIEEFYESLDVILKGIEEHPARAEECLRRTKNNRLECAVDLITGVYNILLYILDSRNKIIIPKFYGYYEELDGYKKELYEMNVSVRNIMDERNRTSHGTSEEVIAERSKEALRELDAMTSELKILIERIMQEKEDGLKKI